MAKILFTLGLARESDANDGTIPEAGSAAPVETPNGQENPGMDTEGSEQIVSETQDADSAAEEVSKTIVTLETFQTILEGAPEDQINETTAQIIDQAMQDISDKYELTNEAHFSRESYFKVGSETYRKIACEDIKSKMEAFKNGLKNIIDKIVELFQRFWDWLTMNRKRLTAALKKTIEDVKLAKEEVKLPMQPSFMQLMITPYFEPNKVVSLLKYMHELSNGAALFANAAFMESSESNFDLGVNFRSAESVKLTVKAAFSSCKEGKDGEILIYSGIGNRDMTIKIDKGGPMGIRVFGDQGFTTYLTKHPQPLESHETVFVNNKEMVNILSAAADLISETEKDFEKLTRITRKFKVWNTLVQSNPDNSFSSNPAIVGIRSYTSTLSKFLDGIFAQSFKMAQAALTLGRAYVKNARDHVTASDEPEFNANAPKLAYN